MKHLNNIFFLLVFSISLNAQLQKAYWYFGFNAGLDFSSGSPVIDTHGMVETNEGCTSISDEFGNLLFYSDGQKVYDRTHAIMQNGGGLFGHASSTSSAVVLPKPDDCSLYYLFTIDARERREKGIHYNIIDMSANGGLGSIVEKNIELPINGIQQGFEKLAAISNADKTGYWIVTHFEGNFYSFPVTGQGVGTNPVVSPSAIFGDKFIGYLKGSPDGSKLGMGMFSSSNNENAGYLSVYDFDPATGIVSNENILYEPTTTPGNYYGIEFSPDSQLLYTTNIILGSNTKIYIEQYNLNASSVPDSKYLVSLNAHYGALQLALDGKIYNSGHQTSSNKYIGAITNPNVAYNPGIGEVPLYDRRYIDLTPYLSQMTPSFGLPTFLNNYFRISVNVNGLKISEEQRYCAEAQLDFNFCYQGGQIESTHWDFGDGNTSEEMYPQHQYDEPGTYTITLTIIVDGEEHFRTFEITITGPPNVEVTSQEICLNTGETHTFNLEESLGEINTNYDITFHLTEQEARNNQNPQPAIYTTDETATPWVRVEDDEGCFVVRELELIVNYNPELTLPLLPEMCAGETITITVTTTSGTVNWYYEETDEIAFHTNVELTTLPLTETTTFWIEAVNGNCTSERQSLTITVNEAPTIEPEQSETICVGNPVELSVTTNGSTVYWYDSPTSTTPIFTGNPFTTPNLTETTTYWVSSTNVFGCASERIEITATVSEAITPEFTQIEPQCFGTEFTLPEQDLNDITGTWTPTINSTATTTYTFHPEEGQCAEQGFTMTVQIVEIPELTLPDEEDLISCIEEAITVSVSTNEGTINWYQNETSEIPFFTGIDYTATLSQTTTFWVEAVNGNCKSEREPITIIVYPTPEMQELEDILICEGESFLFTAPDGFESYQWKNEQNQIISETQQVIFTEEGMYTLTVGINGIPCTLTRNLEIKFSTPPIITEIKTTLTSITVYATGGNPLEYSMDQVFWQSSPTFTNLKPGIFNVFVRDSKGCSTTAKQTGILGVPNFISPNGDGYNDTWKIRGMDAYPNTRLQIFDRYGKQFVDTIIQINYEWNGKYNGQPLPTGTYWYIITLENREKISGHINLKSK